MQILNLNKPIVTAGPALLMGLMVSQTHAGNLPTSSKAKPYRSMECSDLKKELAKANKTLAAWDVDLNEIELKQRRMKKGLAKANERLNDLQKASNTAKSTADKKAKRAELRTAKKNARDSEAEVRFFNKIRNTALKGLQKAQDEENNIKAWMDKKRC